MYKSKSTSCVGIFTSQTPDGNVGECRESISEMSPLRYFRLMLEENLQTKPRVQDPPIGVGMYKDFRSPISVLYSIWGNARSSGGLRPAYRDHPITRKCV